MTNTTNLYQNVSLYEGTRHLIVFILNLTLKKYIENDYHFNSFKGEATVLQRGPI